MDYKNGNQPKEILNLRMYKISIAQCEGKILKLVNKKNEDKSYVFYKDRKE